MPRKFILSIFMDLDPQLPPLPTLTLNTTVLNPPDKTTEPHISILFPENTPYRAPNNPFRGQVVQERKNEHDKALRDALSIIRKPFLFELNEPVKFEGANVDANISTENFNDAVTTVIAAIEQGYYLTQDPTPLGPTDWAKLSCTLLAAVGRGYLCQYATEYESLLEKVRAKAIDPHPLTTKDGDYYKRLAATATGNSEA